MSRKTIFLTAIAAWTLAQAAWAWDFLYMTPLGGRWIRSENPLQVEECDHRSEARLSAMVEELGENQWRLYTVWNRTEYTCVDGSVAFPDGYDRTVYSPKTNALALAAHKADTSNPHQVTSRQADEAGGTAHGEGAVLALYGIVADKTNGVSLLDGNGDAVDFKYDRWVHAGDKDFWFIATNAAWDFRTLGRPMWFGAGLATTGEVAEAATTAAEALSAASTHAGNTNNPHQVTAAQIGALTAETDPVWEEEKGDVWGAIGSLRNEVDNVLSAEADPVWNGQSNDVYGALADLRTDVDALSGGASGSVSSLAAALEGHVEDTGNPHGVTPAQIDVDGALRDYLAGTYGVVLSALPEGVSWLHGFDNNLSFEESQWWRTDERDFLFWSTNSTWAFRAPSAPTYNGTALATVADIASHEARQDNPHGVTADQTGALPATHASSGWYVVEDPTDFEDDVHLLGNTLAVDVTASSLTIGGTTTRDLAEFATDDELAAHTGNTANPHHVTAAQVGALPVVGGTLADGARIYFGDGNHFIGKTEGWLEILSNGNILLDGGATVVNGSLAADSLDAYIVEADRVTIAGVTVTNWNNLPESAANAAHRADTNNPHQVTIAQLDEDEAVAEHLGETYGLHMSEADGVGPIEGFGHYISPEEHLWQWNTGEDLVFASPSGTVDFQTEGVPTFHGTNLATMTDLSVSVAELAPYTWVRSQIAAATAGSYPALPAFNAHTNDANAHGLGALRATVDALPTEARVLTLIDDAIGDLGDVATQDELSNYVPGPVYTAATNDLWGAFAGMATDADIAAATNGLATASSVSALDGRVTVLESAAFGPDGVDVSSLANDLVDVEDRVSVAESDIADLQDIAGAAWPTNPAADERVVFPKMHYYQNESDRPVIDPGFYDQSIAPHRSGAISNLALLKVSKVEAGKMLLHGDPVLASTQFTSNYIAGGSVISMPHTFAAEDEPLWCHYNYPDYIAKLHFVWSNATYTEERTIYDEGTDTETTETVTNHCQPSVSLRITATNVANEEVEFTLVPRLDGTDQVLYIDRVPLYLVNGFTVETSGYPVPTTTADPVLVGFWYEKSQEYGEEYDLYGKVLMVDEPEEARGVANKGYVDELVGGVDLSAIYNRDRTTKLNGHDLVLNPRYTVTWSNNDMTIGYGGFPVMTFKGGMRVEPCMTALTPRGTTIYAYCSGTAASEIRLEWCTNTLASAGMPFEEVPAARIIAQYMSDEYTWCTEIDGTGISACWMRAWLTSLTQALTDVELVTEEGPQSMAELFAKVAELHAATNLYATVTDLTAHTARQDNPHGVTAAQIGALTAETDAAALAALTAASNHFEAAIADLPGLSGLEERLAALEAWRSAYGPAIVTNELFPGVSLTALTALGEKTWNDVAIDENATNVVFAGNDSYLWEETVNGGRSTFSNNSNLPRTIWKSVGVSADGRRAVALPYGGRAYTRSLPGVGRFTQDNGTDGIEYWDKAVMAVDGSFGVAVAGNSTWMFRATSTNSWTRYENAEGDASNPPEYADGFAAATGDILLSRDLGGRRRITLAMSTNSVVDVSLPLPSGVPTNAMVVTRTPYNGTKATVYKDGNSSFPTDFWTTNTYTEKVTGGPYLDVFVTTNAVTKLYVRNASKWTEVKRSAQCAETYWTNSFLYMTNIYVYTNVDYVYIPGMNLSGSYVYETNYWLVGEPVFGPEPEYAVRTQTDIQRTFPANTTDYPDHPGVTSSGSERWWPYWSSSDAGYANSAAESRFPAVYCYTNRGHYSYQIYEVYIPNPTNRNPNISLVVTNRIAATNDRLAEAYEPIEAAGARKWADAAVSMDSQMRRIWAVEAGGYVWRMTGTSWRTGTWKSQAVPGTNQWTQVVCSTDGERAIVIGDCMVPTGEMFGSGSEVVQIEANAWYFDGTEWYPLYQRIQRPDGTTAFQKWKKAFISTGGYSAYLLPEGRGYVYKLTYQ